MYVTTGKTEADRRGFFLKPSAREKQRDVIDDFLGCIRPGALDSPVTFTAAAAFNCHRCHYRKRINQLKASSGSSSGLRNDPPRPKTKADPVVQQLLR